MESTEASSVTIRSGDVIQFQGLLSESDVSEEIIAGSDDVPAPEETTESKAEESVGSDAPLAGQEFSQGSSPPPPAGFDQAPSPPNCEVTPQADTTILGSGDMPQTSPLGFSTHGKVSSLVCQAAAVQA